VIVLVVAAHPDDEVLGCGGVMARHAAHDDEVHVLIATRGAAEMFSDQEIQETRQSMRAAHEVLGVAGAHFLDFPAPKLDLVPGHQLADAISAVTESLHPKVVYLPHLGDLHADHRAVAHATLVAARPLPGCRTRRLLCYETLSATDWAPPSPHDAFVPTVFVDITDYLEYKLRAMSCYRGQVRQPPHTRSLQSIEALARVRGGAVGVHSAEAFVLMRDIID
jgi:LmbE family N-acetylglucosaminyl deacetylase